jgi:hypothetical protein
MSFNALDHGLRSIHKKTPGASTAGARSGGIRNPRTVERSGCTPAEPYPLNRNKKKNFQKKSPSPLTNHIPVYGLFSIFSP